MPEKQENDDDKNGQTHSSARGVIPVSAVPQEDRGQAPVSDDRSLESGRGLPRRKRDNVLLLSDAEPGIYAVVRAEAWGVVSRFGLFASATNIVGRAGRGYLSFCGHALSLGLWLSAKRKLPRNAICGTSNTVPIGL
jgi:hypothetical protein